MGPVGVQEMIVIFLVALVLFGPKKLPELGKTIGKAITEFRRAQSELKSTFETHMRELEKESDSIKEVTRSYTNDIYNSYTGYDSSYDSSAYNPDSISAPVAPATSTTGESASQAAGTPTASHEAPVNGAVPRTTTPETAAEQHPVAESPAADSHSIHNS